MVVPAKLDRRIQSLVAAINGLGLGETVASCDGHECHKALVFAGYSRAPLLEGRIEPIYRAGLAMKNPAYVDLRPDPLYREQVANLLAFVVHQFSRRMYASGSEALRVEVRPGDKFQIYLTHEWDPGAGVFRSVHDLEMRVAWLRKLCVEFDPRLPWDKEIPRVPDVYGSLAFLRQFSPAPAAYPVLA